MAHVRELTPRGRGGVAVLELQGEGTLERLRSVLPQARLSPGSLTLARLAMGGEALDEALVWCESARRVELQLHGSPPLVARVTDELVRSGFERWKAQDGPLSLEARASESLPFAPTEAGARMLLDQSEGALGAELARCAKLNSNEFASRMGLLAERARRARFLLHPARVVLAGVVNAGKSTLFNAMVGSERVLVTPLAGTTRDVVCEATRAGQWPILLYDTAGERALDPAELGATSDALSDARIEASLEAEGQAMGRRTREVADVVLWLCPADGEASPAPPGAHLVFTRADLASAAGAGVGLRLAAGPDPMGARLAIGRLLREALNLPEDPWEPGCGVPFEPWMEPLLRESARTGDRGALAELARAR